MEQASPELRDGGLARAVAEAELIDLARHRPQPAPALPPPPRTPRRRMPEVGQGHRERLRRRLAEGGPEALLDHELVEYLLALAIPRRDTKPLAKRLIDQFGGYGRLLAADPQALRRIGRLNEPSIAALKIAQAAALRLLAKEVRDRPVLGSWQALLDYLRADMAHEAIERVRVLFLNAKNMLIRDEPMWEGSVDESAVYIREIMKRALDYQASAIIIVHNHPSGDPTPSQQDIRLTRDLAEAGRHLRVTLHDHIVIGAAGHSSLRAMGVI
jgi:DNA repair protein RadC